MPWPEATAPAPVRLSVRAGAPLPRADALVVTWTSGEARTMGQLLAGQPLDDWHPYTSHLDEFLPLVTGKDAPFNDGARDNARYYHTLGLYCAVRVGKLSVVVLKSGLHPAYDGPALPMKKLWLQVVDEVSPKLVVTTGTAGGIGAGTKLGDVVLANAVRFHCTGPFKAEPFAQAEYPCPALDAQAVAALVTPSLLAPNATLLPGRRTPTLVLPSVPLAKVVTTDTFAFDDAENTFGLRGLGTACDMGDAVLGLAMGDLSSAPLWTSVRNASDPQVSGDPQRARETAEDIYDEYQDVTTAGSVVVTWATLVGQLGS